MVRGKSDQTIVSFNAGEWAPRLHSRVDLEKAKSACRKVENMIVETYGVARRRPGTKFIATASPDFNNGSVPPTGPAGMVLRINRITTSTGIPLVSPHVEMECMKLATTYEITFASYTGTGCLCGYVEFIPSTPPKRYLKNTLDYVVDDIFGGIVYSGVASYDPMTCINDQGAQFVSAGGAPVSCSNVYYFHCTDTPTTVTATDKTYSLSSSCGTSSGGEHLSEEDTFANALKRAAVDPDAVSGLESLFATQISDYCYTGFASEWTVVFSNLKADCSYKWTITYTRGPDTITEEIVFVPGDTSYVLTGAVPAALGTVTTAATALLEVL